MIYTHPYDMVQESCFLDLTDLSVRFDLYLKVEGLNPAGSIKLKAAVSMVRAAEKSGRLRPGGHFIESSSGNLGIALAGIAARRGYSFTAVVDPNISEQSVRTMRAYGAVIVRVDRRDANGGYLETRLAEVRRIVDLDPRILWLDQYSNRANPAAHQALTAEAIDREFDRVDYLFIGAGTTGTLMGCADYFCEHSPQTRIVAVDSVGSVTFGTRAAPRCLPGLGASRRPPLFRIEAADDHILVEERDTVRMCRHLARRYGYLPGGSTGTIVSAVMRYAQVIPRGSTVVALSPDLGDKYTTTIYDDDWVRATYGPSALSTWDASPVTDHGASEADPTHDKEYA